MGQDEVWGDPPPAVNTTMVILWEPTQGVESFPAANEPLWQIMSTTMA